MYIRNVLHYKLPWVAKNENLFILFSRVYKVYITILISQFITTPVDGNHNTLYITRMFIMIYHQTLIKCITLYHLTS